MNIKRFHGFFDIEQAILYFYSPMKKYILCLIFICCCKIFAQQDPQFTLSYTNQLFFNPATIGTRNCIGATLQGRLQWNGLKGAPISWGFGLDMPFMFGKTKQNVIGFGMLGYGNYIGYSIDGGLKFSLNYRRCRVGPGDLSLGIDMGIASKRIANPVWVTPNGQPDSSLPNPNTAGDAFDMGIGAYYSGDNFYAGVSCLHINAASIPALSFRFARHMYFNGGGFIPLGAKKNWRLNPHAIVRTDFATANFDVGLNALCFVHENHAIIFGSTYRFIDAVAFNIGYAYKYTQRNKTGMFMIAYNYDINTSRLHSFNSGSNELVLRFFFPAKDVKFQRVFF
jgi:type IX secretion system PorP/SprF family membrane protein